MKMTVFRDIVPFSLVEVNRRFRGAYYYQHHYQSDRHDAEASPHLCNVGLLQQDVMVQCAKAVIYHLMHYRPDLCSWRCVFKCPKEDPHAVQVAMKCWPPIGCKPGDSKSARFTRYQFLAVV
jgi:hypothetical protein